MKISSRWIGLLAKPAIVAVIIGFFSFFGLSDQIAGFSANLGEKDRLVRWAAVLSGATRDAIPVTLVDIDDAAMAALGHPAKAPRDLLAGLISLASTKRAAGIFLDMDTSQPGPSPAADDALAALIAAYPSDAPPLALVRRLGSRGGEGDLVAEPSILDGAVSGRANVLWAASLTRVDEDRVVRRWQLSQTLCASRETLPSPQLVATAVAGGRPQPLADIRAFTNERTRAICGEEGGTPPVWPRNPEPRAAIPFLIADGPETAAPQFIEQGGRGVPLFRRVSARNLLRAEGAVVAPAKVADDLVRGRFVIIGASHAESMDGHLTPIGFMPGALIVANAVATAPSILDARPLGPIGATLVALVLFGVLAAITSRLRALAAGVVVAVAVLGLLMLLGRILAPSMASDIVLAAFGMLAFFSTVESLYTVGREWRVRGWRALLKPEKPPAVQQTGDAA